MGYTQELKKYSAEPATQWRSTCIWKTHLAKKQANKVFMYGLGQSLEESKTYDSSRI